VPGPCLETAAAEDSANKAARQRISQSQRKQESAAAVGMKFDDPKLKPVRDQTPARQPQTG
jgi:hypothetical protein